MGQPAAKQGDRVVAVDTHLVVVPGAPKAVPLPHPFAGLIGGGLSTDVRVMGKPAAVVGSTADNTPPHLPTAPGTGFERPPANKATIQLGSQTVMVNGKPLTRNGDKALTCNDPSDLPVGTVVAVGTVMVG
jgi:uncharacterized Zn-binding protein involved in type VI secretion